MLGKEEITFAKALDKYRDNYNPNMHRDTEKTNSKKQYVHLILILVCFYLIYIYYDI